MSRETKTFQVRLSLELFEKFLRAFPGRGERKLLVERFIEIAVERAKMKDAFIEGVLMEAREYYSDLREEYYANGKEE